MSDKNKKITECNREAWNEALRYHQQARGGALRDGFATPGFTTFDRDCDGVLIDKLESMDLSGKTIAQAPCNNGRELLSLMRFGAREAVGFDISDAAVDEARRLAEISGLNARFERVDLLELDGRYDNRFDFIYVSEGSLQWFPDLNEYFGVVARLLKKGGKTLIYEMHPFAYFFENGFDPANPDFGLLTSYFEKGPYRYENGLDYVGGVKYKAKECRWFMHKLSDIFTALSKNKLGIQEFEEYNFEMANNEALQFLHKFPLSYLLTAEKRE